ncbi:MAG: DUF1624 domain-containing protein, partial [Halobacteriovoraceae bacterium]|nr:DUF1624 domain-containing protein [Halobacteriovoraceae bacterium]
FLANKSSKAEEKKQYPRYEVIDVIRATAVILMIIFHLSYDLNVFKFVSIDFQRDPLWWTFPRVIVFLFLTAMGLSFELGKKEIPIKKVAQRFLKIGGYALIISITTKFLFPKNWIYFGTLHCIAVCSILALPVRHRPKLAWFLSAAFLIPLLFGFHWPFFKLPHPSMDYIPAFPWIGVVFMGMGLHHLGFHKFQVPDFPGKKIVLMLSQYSLFIYIIHQPILFGITFLVHKLFR